MTQPMPPRGARNDMLGNRLMSDPRTHIALLLVVVPLGLIAVGHAFGFDRDEISEQHLMRYFVIGGTAVVLATVLAIALTVRLVLRSTR